MVSAGMQLVTGIAIMGVGIWAKLAYSHYFQFAGNAFLSAPILLIIIGCIIIVIAFFGCCGAIRENHCMIVTFSVLLGIIFVLELAAGIAAYVLRNDLQDLIDKGMKDGMDHYGDDVSVTKTWDAIQHDLNCCGINGTSDWNKFAKDKFGVGETPDSCCVKDIKHCGKNTTFIKHQEGCFKQIFNKSRSTAYVVGGVGVGIAFVQIIGIIFACCLASAIKREYEVVTVLVQHHYQKKLYKMRLAVGTAKFLLFFFNFIFFVTGILIIVVASLAISNTQELTKHLESGVKSVPIFLIVVGLFVAVIAFFGCCGAIRNSYCMLMTFAAILGIIFVFEFGAGIAAYTKKDDIIQSVKNGFDELMNDYKKNDTAEKDAVDALQQSFKCCGRNGSDDWKKRGEPVPNSCCPKVEDKSVTCTDNTTFKDGCYDAFTNFISDNITIIGGIGVGIAFIQILGIVLSCCLATAVKDQV
uniref:Uncharacterized protein n=1 Tax=Strigamia maritima TaxID=126957 RepID=T1II96_STRMM